MSQIEKAKRIYEEKGLVELAKATKEFLYSKITRSIPFSSGPIYQKSRKQATEKRWELIEEHLSEDDRSLLDIGCNAGMFTKRAAKKGIFSVGVDRFPEKYSSTKKFAGKEFIEGENIGFLQLSIDPKNIELLPRYDVVLLLAVYHHWYREFGKENAEEMLKYFRGAEKIFFEPPSRSSMYVRDNEKNTPEPSFEDEDRESIKRYHEELFKSVLGEEYSVKVIGKSRIRGHHRYLFLVEKGK